ncbi:Energy-coupling factor transporter ATP-binding protein EcfA2 [compost metagenome]
MCASDNKLIVLDEPTNGLDPKIAKQIYEMLSNLKNDTNLTILMVSHDIDRALNYADHVIELQNGRVSFDGKPSDFSIGGAK